MHSLSTNPMPSLSPGGVVWRIRASDTRLVCAAGSRNGTEETKLLLLDFEPEERGGDEWGGGGEEEEEEEEEEGEEEEEEKMLKLEDELNV